MRAGEPARRAQGDRPVPWPDGMVDEPDLCCVALRVRLAGIDRDGKLRVTLDRPRVAVGPAQATLLELIRYRFGDAKLAAHYERQRDVSREVLEFELAQLGWIDPRCPLRLERILVLAEQKEFIEALILPVGEREAAELCELTRTAPDAIARHETAWEYAQRLERRWEQRAPGGRIPRRYLDADFQPATAAHSSGERGGGRAATPRSLLPADL